MPDLIGTGQLATLRRITNSAMPTPATISRAGVVIYPLLTMPGGSPLRCRVSLGKSTTIPAGTPYDRQPTWQITLPDNLPLQLGDTIATPLGTYGVLELLNPTSYSVATTVLTLRLTDANGSPLYLQPNATITSLRQDGTPVYDGPRSVRWLTQAQAVERVVASGGEITRWLFDLPDGDYRINDRVTLVSLVGYAQPPDITRYWVNAIDAAASASGISWLEIGLGGKRANP